VQTQIEVTAVGPVPPQADIEALTPATGDAPLVVDFTAQGSTDDGIIMQYEWDFEGDGVFEYDSGLNSEASHQYNTPGTYQAAVRVTDDESLSSTAELTVEVTGVDPGFPVADLFGDPASGQSPLNVNFDASLSFDTNGGTIDLYEWDWDGDGTYDEDSGSSPFHSHVFFAEGTYNVSVRVTDNDSLSDEAQFEIQVVPPGGGTFSAVLYANPRYGPIGQKVDFDASQSSSPDGDIVLYEWDWDGDGTYENSGPESFVTRQFDNPGVYDCTVRVTDEIGQQGEKIMLVLITPDGSFPPDDSIFALPSQSHCQAGEAVGVEIYCKGTANPFQYLLGAGMTMPTGTEYKPMTFNIGQFGGAQAFVDGVWPQVNPGSFLLPPDSFLQFTDIGGGRSRIDLNVVPLGGSDASSATGALCNLEFHIAATTEIGFERINVVKRTYYSDGPGIENYWNDDDNSGLPTIEVLP
jgi:PKD repeat protein